MYNYESLYPGIYTTCSSQTFKSIWDRFQSVWRKCERQNDGVAFVAERSPVQKTGSGSLLMDDRQVSLALTARYPSAWGAAPVAREH